MAYLLDWALGKYAGNWTQDLMTMAIPEYLDSVCDRSALGIVNCANT